MCDQCEALKQENERLKDNYQTILDSHVLVTNERNEARAERDQLKSCAVSSPQADCYSADGTEYWVDCPDDIDFVDGRTLGEEYEIYASVRAWKQCYRVTKVPDDVSDDYEVELVTPAPLPEKQPKTLHDFGYAPGNYTGRCCHCKQPMEWVDKRCSCCKSCAEKLLSESTQKLTGEQS